MMRGIPSFAEFVQMKAQEAANQAATLQRPSTALAAPALASRYGNDEASLMGQPMMRAVQAANEQYPVMPDYSNPSIYVGDSATFRDQPATARGMTAPLNTTVRNTPSLFQTPIPNFTMPGSVRVFDTDAKPPLQVADASQGLATGSVDLAFDPEYEYKNLVANGVDPVTARSIVDEEVARRAEWAPVDAGLAASAEVAAANGSPLLRKGIGFLSEVSELADKPLYGVRKDQAGKAYESFQLLENWNYNTDYARYWAREYAGKEAWGSQEEWDQFRRDRIIANSQSMLGGVFGMPNDPLGVFGMPNDPLGVSGVQEYLDVPIEELTIGLPEYDKLNPAEKAAFRRGLIDAYDNGFAPQKRVLTDVGVYVDQPTGEFFEPGARAAWEYIAGQQGTVARVIETLISDPLNAPFGGFNVVGRRFIREGAERAARAGAERAVREAGEVVLREGEEVISTQAGRAWVKTPNLRPGERFSHVDDAGNYVIIQTGLGGAEEAITRAPVYTSRRSGEWTIGDTINSWVNSAAGGVRTGVGIGLQTPDAVLNYIPDVMIEGALTNTRFFMSELPVVGKLFQDELKTKGIRTLHESKDAIGAARDTRMFDRTDLGSPMEGPAPTSIPPEPPIMGTGGVVGEDYPGPSPDQPSAPSAGPRMPNGRPGFDADLTISESAVPPAAADTAPSITMRTIGGTEYAYLGDGNAVRIAPVEGEFQVQQWNGTAWDAADVPMQPDMESAVALASELTPIARREATTPNAPRGLLDTDPNYVDTGDNPNLPRVTKRETVKQPTLTPSQSVLSGQGDTGPRMPSQPTGLAAEEVWPSQPWVTKTQPGGARNPYIRVWIDAKQASTLDEGIAVFEDYARRATGKTRAESMRPSDKKGGGVVYDLPNGGDVWKETDRQIKNFRKDWESVRGIDEVAPQPTAADEVVQDATPNWVEKETPYDSPAVTTDTFDVETAWPQGDPSLPDAFGPHSGRSELALDAAMRGYENPAAGNKFFDRYRKIVGDFIQRDRKLSADIKARGFSDAQWDEFTNAKKFYATKGMHYQTPDSMGLNVEMMGEAMRAYREEFGEAPEYVFRYGDDIAIDGPGPIPTNPNGGDLDMGVRITYEPDNDMAPRYAITWAGDEWWTTNIDNVIERAAFDPDEEIAGAARRFLRIVGKQDPRMREANSLAAKARVRSGIGYASEGDKLLAQEATAREGGTWRTLVDGERVPTHKKYTYQTRTTPDGRTQVWVPASGEGSKPRAKFEQGRQDSSGTTYMHSGFGGTDGRSIYDLPQMKNPALRAVAESLFDEIKYKNVIEASSRLGIPFYRPGDAIPPSPSGYVRLVHGTADANVPSILRDGLLPSADRKVGERLPFVLFSRDVSPFADGTAPGGWYGDVQLIYDVPIEKVPSWQSDAVEEGRIISLPSLQQQPVGFYGPRRTDITIDRAIEYEIARRIESGDSVTSMRSGFGSMGDESPTPTRFRHIGLKSWRPDPSAFPTGPSIGPVAPIMPQPRPVVDSKSNAILDTVFTGGVHDKMTLRQVHDHYWKMAERDQAELAELKRMGGDADMVDSRTKREIGGKLRKNQYATDPALFPDDDLSKLPSSVRMGKKELSQEVHERVAYLEAKWSRYGDLNAGDAYELAAGRAAWEHALSIAPKLTQERKLFFDMLHALFYRLPRTLLLADPITSWTYVMRNMISNTQMTGIYDIGAVTSRANWGNFVKNAVDSENSAVAQMYNTLFGSSMPDQFRQSAGLLEEVADTPTAQAITSVATKTKKIGGGPKAPSTPTRRALEQIGLGWTTNAGRPFDWMRNVTRNLERSSKLGAMVPMLNANLGEAIYDVADQASLAAWRMGVGDINADEIAAMMMAIRDGNGVFSRDQLYSALFYRSRQMGATDDLAGRYADRVTRDWIEAARRASDKTIAELNHIFPNALNQTNLDHYLSYVTLFHFWPTRAMVFMAEEMIRNPRLIVNWYRAHEGFERMAEEGEYPESVKGLIRLWKSPLGFSLYSNPAALFLVTALLPTQAERGETNGVTWFGSILQSLREKTGLAPIPMLEATLSLVGIYGDNYMPDIIPSRTYDLATAALDYALTSSGHRPHTPFWDQKMLELREMVTSAVPGVSTIEAGNAGGYARDMVGSMILEQNPDLARRMTAVGPDGRPTADAVAAKQEYLAIIENPSDPRYREAESAVYRGGLWTRMVNLVFPFSTRSVLDSRAEAVQLNKEEDAAMDAGLTPTEGQRRGGVLRGTVSNTPEAQRLETQRAADLAFGSEEDREIHRMWTAIAYADQEDLPNAILINGRWWWKGDFVQMDQETRFALADTYVEQIGATEQYELFKEGRDNLRATMPEFQAYEDWKDWMREQPGEIAGARVLLMEWSPGYRSYIDGLDPSFKEDPETFDRMSTSVDAYLAAQGKPGSVYAGDPGDATDISNIPAYMLVGGGESSSKSGGSSTSKADTAATRLERLNKDIREYDAAMEKFNAKVREITGGALYEDLAPMWQESLKRRLEREGIKVPSKPSTVANYEEWLALNPEGTKMSYIEWLMENDV